MARNVSLLKIQGTIAGLTFVRSATYGDHIRAKRGTYKKAELNDALKKESRRLQLANVPAKIFKDAIEPYRGVLRQGTLWPRLVSLFRKQIKESGKTDMAKVPPFEINTRYQFKSLMTAQTTIAFNKLQQKLTVRIECATSPQFKKAKQVDAYTVTAIGLFPDLKKKTALTSVETSPIIKLSDKVSEIELQLRVPKRHKTYIVCLKIQGYCGKDQSGLMAANGLCVIGSGNIEW